jgi:hypothetical protein
MNKLNIDLLSVLLIALITKSIVDGGSFPIAIAVVAILASQAHKAFLSKKEDTKGNEQAEELKLMKDRISSVESKYAMTMGTNRLK